MKNNKVPCSAEHHHRWCDGTIDLDKHSVGRMDYLGGERKYWRYICSQESTKDAVYLRDEVIEYMVELLDGKQSKLAKEAVSSLCR